MERGIKGLQGLKTCQSMLDGNHKDRPEFCDVDTTALYP